MRFEKKAWTAALAAACLAAALLPAGCGRAGNAGEAVDAPVSSQPAAPAQVEAAADGLHTIRVSWSAVEGAGSYRVTLSACGQGFGTDGTSAAGGPSETAASPPGSETAVPAAAGEAGNAEAAREGETTGAAASGAAGAVASDPGQQTEAASLPSGTAGPENAGESQTRTVTGTGAVFDGLPAACRYTVTVAAVGADGGRESAPARTQAETPAPEVGTVSGLTAEGVSEEAVQLEWNAYAPPFTNADGSAAAAVYAVYAADAQDGDYRLAAENLTDARYTDTGLAPETARFYKVAVRVTVDGRPFFGEPCAAAGASTRPAPTTTKPTTATQPTAAKPAATRPPTQSKAEQARAVAQQIADSIGPGTDLERVSQAAMAVSQYCSKAAYTTQGSDYSQAYGVFIKGEYSCAGATRALGMVLECMGYTWEHVNENQWTHQWCRLEMDGQVGWADGQLGWAGYGQHPVAGS